VRQTGTGRVDNGEYYNAIHFSEHVELPAASEFINNRIEYAGGHGNAINSQHADGAHIIGNRADHFNHSGFDIKDSASVVIRGNVAHDAAESNGIYQDNCANTMIENNVVYNLSGSLPGRGSGIQIDTGSSGTKILGNSISNVLTGIYLVTPATVAYNMLSNAEHSVLEANAGGVFHHNTWGTAPIFYLNGRRYDFALWRASDDNVDNQTTDQPEFRYFH
jgi:hypothetical protein